VNGALVVVDDVAESFARLLAEQIAANSEPRFSLAFSGGSTARECYFKFASVSGTSINWSSLEAWWGDERCVPLDDPDSNFRLVSESLLSRVGPFASVHPMRSDVPDAAETYEQLVRGASPIDVIHLGLGPDGHTASLFPESSALTASADRLVVSNVDPLGNNPYERLTFTYAGIARCRTCVVTVTGEAKRDALHRVLDGDQTAPATRIDGANVIWLVDALAMGPRLGR
jgi:6-phosphogluconolactonase